MMKNLNYLKRKSSLLHFWNILRTFLPFLHLTKVKFALKLIGVLAYKLSTYKNKIYRNLFYRKSFGILHQLVFPEGKDDGCSWKLYSQQQKHVNSNFRKFNEWFVCLMFRISRESFQATFRAESDDGRTVRTTESRPSTNQRIATETGRNHGRLWRFWRNTERGQAVQINGKFLALLLICWYWKFQALRVKLCKCDTFSNVKVR